ncbi:MAG: C-terminal binding protein [Dehalococcoidia bacterium]|nr:C-terminal binding protein [Dehalococcoidia bacterium]
MLPPMADEGFLVVHADAVDEAAFMIERQIIEAAGGVLRLSRSATEDERITALREADAVLVSAAQMTPRVCQGLDRCKLIVRYGVGLDSLDIPAATDCGIVIAHFPDFCQPEVANHALMLLLASAKKLVPLDRAVRSGQWRPGPLGPMQHITGQTLGLVAYGNIARFFAKRARSLDLEILAYDPYVPDEVFAADGVERASSLDALLERSDYVSVHTPLTPETHHLMGAAQFRAMKPTAYLINTSRGPVVDEAALVDALRAGEIAGTGLDVFEQEPLPGSSPLAEMENVVLMPHSASYSDRAFDTMKRRVGETVVDVLVNGRWPEFVPNRATVRPRVALS